ncbi:serine protease inhibitor 42Dd-like [Sitodiplosis mosellana]|uniref:serine protease inhibitor 42Dd-like n=1 Tax=Sitodiplosis mosellana TaxID=263140 RepID=UPI0024441C22|nr:serine protease inhibitor 42Dd-like [Sitodiplosis mosellana]
MYWRPAADKMLRFLTTISIYSLIVTSGASAIGVWKAISNFASDFYQESAKSTTGNVIISPFLVANSLALLLQAANGNTFDQIRNGLHLSGDKTAIANQFLEHYGMLQRGIGSASLSIANQIYVQQGNELNKTLQEVAVQKFQSAIESVDFAKRDDTAQAINHFVEEKTQGKIKELIQPNMLTSDSGIILLNAIYFKGDWERKFNEKFLTKQNFHNSETETVSVDFMHIEDEFNFALLDDLDAAALEMKIRLETKLKHHSLASIIHKMRLEEVEVDIPKFKFEFEIKLNDVLKHLGIGEMFTPKTDLSGFFETGESLQVSDVLHMAFIEVNEGGCEAAGVTSYKVVTRNNPVKFRANRPFLYFIWDNNSKTTVFSGRITALN